MKKIIKTFFYAGEDFQPVYFYVCMLMIALFICLGLRIVGFSQIDNALVLGLCGFVATWCGLFNLDRRMKP